MGETKGWTRKVISMGLLDEREYTAGLHSSFDASLNKLFSLKKIKNGCGGLRRRERQLEQEGDLWTYDAIAIAKGNSIANITYFL